MRKLMLAALLMLLISVAPGGARAEDAPKIPCPDKNPCRILFLSDAEFNMLMGDRGILATAAQARNLDLGGVAVFLQGKLAAAPHGEIPADKPVIDAPVDKH